MKVVVKAIVPVKPYIKKNGEKYLGGYSYYTQEYPNSPIIIIYADSSYQKKEGETIEVEPAIGKENKIYFRIKSVL